MKLLDIKLYVVCVTDQCHLEHSFHSFCLFDHMNMKMAVRLCTCEVPVFSVKVQLLYECGEFDASPVCIEKGF